MYPPLPFLDRICTADEYALEAGSKFVIPRGMPVFIPVYAIQRDPQVTLYNVFTKENQLHFEFSISIFPIRITLIQNDLHLRIRIT